MGCFKKADLLLSGSLLLLGAELVAASSSLFLNNLLTLLLILSNVDVLHEDTLVLEDVTLGLAVELAVPIIKNKGKTVRINAQSREGKRRRKISYCANM